MEQTRALYTKWIRVNEKGCAEAWKDKRVFYEWCEKSGYKPGQMLYRKDRKKPFGPDNCFWSSAAEKQKNPEGWEADFCRRWAKAVNGGRKQLGLPLLPED